MASGKNPNRHAELRYDPEKRNWRLINDEDSKLRYMPDTRKFGYAASDSEVILDTTSRKWRYKRPEQ